MDRRGHPYQWREDLLCLLGVGVGMGAVVDSVKLRLSVIFPSAIRIACCHHTVRHGQGTTWRSPPLSRSNTWSLSSSWPLFSNYEYICPVTPCWHQLFFIHNWETHGGRELLISSRTGSKDLPPLPTVKGGRRQGRQKKRREDNIREWIGLELAISQRAGENREKWRRLVVQLSVVPQQPSRLRDRWWWWWWWDDEINRNRHPLGTQL